MRVLFIGDPHIKINRFDLGLRFLSWLNELIAREKPDLVVNLGDTFDTHAVVRSEVMGEFMKHVYATLDLGIPYVYLLGNHDQFRPGDSKYHAMSSFKGKIANLYVVDEVTELFGMTFVPYLHNSSGFPKVTKQICVAHQTFIGADYGAIRAKEGVDPDSISGAELIISGHIHTRSTLGERVRYVGSPFSQSASDVDQVKGISIYETDTLREEFKECPLPKWRRICAEISSEFSAADVHAKIASEMWSSKDHWIIELTGPKAEVVSYINSKQYNELVKDIDVKVKTTFTDNEKKKISIEAKSMEHIISEYVAKVYSGAIDKEKLIEKAKEVLNEARLAK